MEIQHSIFDAIKRHTYRPIELAFGEAEAIAATLTDVRAEGTSDLSLSLRFDTPMYGALASKLGSALVLSVGDDKYNARLHAVHPESVNVVAITVRVR